MNAWARAACTTLALSGIGLLMASPINDPDLWWLLRGGRYMVETRSFPTTDPFSASAAGALWVNHAWGFELLLYGVYRVAGVTGLIGMQVLFAVATFGLLYRLLRREGVGQGWAWLVIGLGAVATRGFWSPRPQLVTYLCLAVLWAVLRGYRDGRTDHLLWLPPLTLVWANLHGGFMLSPALIALCLVVEVAALAFRGAAPTLGGQRLPRLAVIGVGCVAATFVTPFHYRAVLFPFQVMGDRLAKSMIIEWASPPFRHPQAMVLEGLVLATLVLLLLTPRPAAFSDLAVLVVFVHLAFQSRRNVPLLVILLTPILGRLLAESFAGRVADRAVPGWLRQRGGAVALAAALLPVVVWAAWPLRPLRELVPRMGIAEVFPAQAVEFLKHEPRAGALFNDYDWGGYLIWHLFPQYRVWIDGRAAVYGPRLLSEHAEVDEVRPRWRQALDRSGVGLALIRARSTLDRKSVV